MMISVLVPFLLYSPDIPSDKILCLANHIKQLLEHIGLDMCTCRILHYIYYLSFAIHIGSSDYESLN